MKPCYRVMQTEKHNGTFQRNKRTPEGKLIYTEAGVETESVNYVGTVIIEIDHNELRTMVDRAIRSKGKACCGGPIRVKFTGTRETLGKGD